MERFTIVPCKTAWGQWYQTMEEVTVEIDVPEGTTSKEIKVNILPNVLRCYVKGKTVLEGDLYATVLVDDSLWSLEDRKLLRIVLLKAKRLASDCWKSLLKGQYEADPFTQDNMEKKLTLEKFQKEYVDEVSWK